MSETPSACTDHEPADIGAQAALAKVAAAARAGEIAAQTLLGQLHCEGRGIAFDPAEGLYWYTLAGNCGDRTAMNMVGRCHELGHGTPVDEALAAAWYRKAAGCGFDWGMYNLANLLATGRGAKRDRAAAFAWYQRAAALGHAKSMNLVGRHCEEGWEVARDAKLAADWYRRSALAGDFRGQASLAAVLAQIGRIHESATWLRRAITGGNAVFRRKLGAELVRSPHALLRALGDDALAHDDKQEASTTLAQSRPAGVPLPVAVSD